MTDDNHLPNVVVEGESLPRVTRSSVPPGKGYLEYRSYLRRDFFYCCAYCSMSEAEAQSIRFTIDHYEPRKKRADLEHDYSNLMYACDLCNRLKGDRFPSPEDREKGLRFFRIDSDVHSDHFKRGDLRLTGRTPTGEFSIEALDLNRQSLRRLREIRRRLTACEEMVTEGVLGLRRFHIDQLPPYLKGKANASIKSAVDTADRIAEEIDGLLRDNAKSDLIDDDPDFKARAKERAAKLKAWGSLAPENWRARISR